MRTEQPTKCFVPLQKLRVRLAPYRPFQGGSFVVVLCYLFLVSEFHLTCVHIILARFRLLSGHLLGNICSLG